MGLHHIRGLLPRGRVLGLGEDLKVLQAGALGGRLADIAVLVVRHALVDITPSAGGVRGGSDACGCTGYLQLLDFPVVGCVFTVASNTVSCVPGPVNTRQLLTTPGMTGT